MTNSEHPFDQTRERVVQIKEVADRIESSLSQLNQRGVDQGIASEGDIQQLGGESWGAFLARLVAALEVIGRLRVRSMRHKDLFYALYDQPLKQIESQLTGVVNAIQSIVHQPPVEARNRANQILLQEQTRLNQINLQLSRLETRLPHATYYLSKKEPVADMEEHLNEVLSVAEEAARKIRSLESMSVKKVHQLEELLPRAEELEKEIRALSAILARDLTNDVEAQTLDLIAALKLLGEKLTTVRSVLEERLGESEELSSELNKLVLNINDMEGRAEELLKRSEEVLGHAEGVGLAKWFKQAFEEYERKLAQLRERFERAFMWAVGLITAYILAMPFAASWLERKAVSYGLDGNIFVSLFGKFVVITPITIGLFYFWRIYNEYATTERLGHRYRHWQALGASLGGFRMLAGSGELGDEMTTALFRAVIEDPLQRSQTAEETGLLRRFLGIRYKKKGAGQTEEELAAGIMRDGE